MKKFKLIFVVLVVLAFVLTACGSGGSPDNVMTGNSGTNMDGKDNLAEDMSDEENVDMVENGHGDDMNDDNMNEAMNDTDDEMMDPEDKDDMSGEMDDSVTSLPWFDYEFVEVTNGETFTINSMRGQVVLVEMMATWCSNCMKQQEQVKELRNLLADRDDFDSVGISVELELDPMLLSKYVEEYGFDWRYGIADQGVQAEIISSLGGQFLNPPSTPIVIVDKDGGVHPLPLGKIKTADELLAFVEPFLN